MIAKETQHRLDMYQKKKKKIKIHREFPNWKIFGNRDDVNGVSAKTSSEGEVTIQIYVDKNDFNTRKRLPSRINGIPTELIERNEKVELLSCRNDIEYDNIKGNQEIATQDEAGTLGLVGKDSSTGNKVVLTAWHVVESDKDTLYQPGWPTDIGSYLDHSGYSSTGYDIVKYSFNPSGTKYASVGATQESSQPSIQGTWTYSGLQDYLDLEGDLPVSYAGKVTCYAETRCTDVAKGSIYQHTAYMDDNVTQRGDSGGPFVDDNGYLVCLLSGRTKTSNQDAGGVAEEALNRVGASL